MPQKQLPKTTQIAVFASGEGTNAENLFRYFQNHPTIKITLLVCNNPKAGVIARVENAGIPVEIIDREQWKNAESIISILKGYKIDYIVLAGFLWLIPEALVNAYPNKIINIHPSLLPKFGGKGMYGMKVHQAVKQAGEGFTGITIHFIDNEYDKGKVIFQEKVEISPNDTPDDISAKVRGLELKYLPEIVEGVIENSKFA